MPTSPINRTNSGFGVGPGQDAESLDPISMAVSKSNIAQLLRAAREETSTNDGHSSGGKFRLGSLQGNHGSGSGSNSNSNMVRKFSSSYSNSTGNTNGYSTTPSGPQQSFSLSQPSRPFTPVCSDRSLFDTHEDYNHRPSSSHGGFNQQQNFQKNLNSVGATGSSFANMFAGHSLGDIQEEGGLSSNFQQNLNKTQSGSSSKGSNSRQSGKRHSGFKERADIRISSSRRGSGAGNSNSTATGSTTSSSSGGKSYQSSTGTNSSTSKVTDVLTLDDDGQATNEYHTVQDNNNNHDSTDFDREVSEITTAIRPGTPEKQDNSEADINNSNQLQSESNYLSYLVDQIVESLQHYLRFGETEDEVDLVSSTKDDEDEVEDPPTEVDANKTTIKTSSEIVNLIAKDMAEKSTLSSQKSNCKNYLNPSQISEPTKSQSQMLKAIANIRELIDLLKQTQEAGGVAGTYSEFGGSDVSAYYNHYGRVLRSLLEVVSHLHQKSNSTNNSASTGVNQNGNSNASKNYYSGLCLLRLARCGFELLDIDRGKNQMLVSQSQLSSGNLMSSQNNSSHSTSQAYLLLCKAVFRCSKNSKNDQLFMQENMTAPLLKLLRDTLTLESGGQQNTIGGETLASPLTFSSPTYRTGFDDGFNQTVNHIRVFSLGTLKNVSVSDTSNFNSNVTASDSGKESNKLKKEASEEKDNDSDESSDSSDSNLSIHHALIKHRALPIVVELLNLSDELTAYKYRNSLEQVWVQAVALLRNMVNNMSASEVGCNENWDTAVDPGNQNQHYSNLLIRDIKNTSLIDVLSRLTAWVLDSQSHSSFSINAKELLMNLSRLMSKLSLIDSILLKDMIENQEFLKQVIALLEINLILGDEHGIEDIDDDQDDDDDDEESHGKENDDNDTIENQINDNIANEHDDDDDSKNENCNSTSYNESSKGSLLTTTLPSKKSGSSSTTNSSKSKFSNLHFTQTLTLRMAFVLGNMCTTSSSCRKVFMLDCDGLATLPILLSKYWNQSRKLSKKLQSLKSNPVNLVSQKNNFKTGQLGSQETDFTTIEDVLTKLVRLVANVAVEPSIGPLCASNASIVNPILDMLGSKRISDPVSEELVLNLVATVTNLLYYGFNSSSSSSSSYSSDQSNGSSSPSNLLFETETKNLLCRLGRNLLLESENLEATMEISRALGNLSRHSDIRKVMISESLKLDEIVCWHVEAQDHTDLLYYLCGILVNLAQDPYCSSRLTCLVPRLIELLQMENESLSLVLLKVLINLSVIKGPPPPQNIEDENIDDQQSAQDSTVLAATSTSPPLFRVLTNPQLKSLRTACSALVSSATTQDLSRLAENFLSTLPQQVDTISIENYQGVEKDEQDGQEVDENDEYFDEEEESVEEEEEEGEGEEDNEGQQDPESVEADNTDIVDMNGTREIDALRAASQLSLNSNDPTGVKKTSPKKRLAQRFHQSSSSSSQSNSSTSDGAQGSLGPNSKDSNFNNDYNSSKESTTESNTTTPIENICPPHANSNLLNSNSVNNYYQFACDVPECGRKFQTAEKLEDHLRRRHR